jgi:DNA-binding transcriptional MerR regulator
MAEKGYIPDHLKDAVFLAKKAGSFSDVPLRTLQSWTEKGLVIPGIEDTTGTGSKRLYSVLNCIEIAIIKEFTKERMRLDIVKRLMDYLREPHTYKKVDGKLIPATKVTVLEKLLINKPGFLVYEFGEGDVPSLSFVTYEDLHEVARKRFGKPFSSKEKHIRDSVIEHLPYLALPMNYLKKVILNITVIADRVLEKMG